MELLAFILVCRENVITKHEIVTDITHVSEAHNLLIAFPRDWQDYRYLTLSSWAYLVAMRWQNCHTGGRTCRIWKQSFDLQEKN